MKTSLIIIIPFLFFFTVESFSQENVSKSDTTNADISKLRTNKVYKLIAYNEFVNKYGSKRKTNFRADVFIIKGFIYANLTTCIEKSDGSFSSHEEIGYVKAKIPLKTK